MDGICILTFPSYFYSSVIPVCLLEHVELPYCYGLSLVFMTISCWVARYQSKFLEPLCIRLGCQMEKCLLWANLYNCSLLVQFITGW